MSKISKLLVRKNIFVVRGRGVVRGWVESRIFVTAIVNTLRQHQHRYSSSRVTPDGHFFRIDAGLDGY